MSCTSNNLPDGLDSVQNTILVGAREDERIHSKIIEIWLAAKAELK